MNLRFKKSLILAFVLLALTTLIGCGGGGGGNSSKDNTAEDPNSPYHHDGEIKTLFKNADKGVNIIFLGDGYTQDDLEKGGAYDQVAEDAINYIVEQVPFKQYKQYINAYTIYAQSQDQGADDNPNQDIRNTVFNACFDDSNNRLLTIQNKSAVHTYLSKINVTPHIVIISVNDIRWGGSGGEFAVISRNAAAKLGAFHEVCHSFAGLIDEYVDPEQAPYFPLSNVPNYCNVDNTNDPNRVKWKHFFGIPGYEMVGTFEGGYYRANGIWRPQENCTMNMLGVSLCNVCREAVVKKIFQINNLPYSFDKFLQNNDPSDIQYSTRVNGHQLSQKEIKNLMFNDYIPH